MSDNPLAVLISPPPSSDDADYDSICAAVMGMERGPWFLAEYARRNRFLDTESGLAAIQRIETAIRGEQGAESFDRFRLDVLDMAQAIARTKAEIAAIKPDAAHQSTVDDAGGELDPGKMLQALELLEGRITSMIDIWGEDVAEVSLSEEPAAETPPTPVSSLAEAGLVEEDAGAMLEPSSISAEPRQDASIEDIGRSMLALDPLIAATLHETAVAQEPRFEKEDPITLALAADSASETEQLVDPGPQPVASLALAMAALNLTPVDAADVAPVEVAEAVTPQEAAEPPSPPAFQASIVNRIQAALHLLPLALPKPVGVEAAEALAPTDNLPSDPVATSEPQSFMPSPDLNASSAAIAAEAPPETETEAKEAAAESALHLLDFSYVPVFEPPAEAAAVEASSPAVEFPIIEEPPASTPVEESQHAVAAEPSIVEEPPAAARVDEPQQVAAALDIEAADFLFEPSPSVEVAPAAGVEEQAPVTVADEMDPADFLFAPEPSASVSVAESGPRFEANAATVPFENLLATALELPTSETVVVDAIPASQPSEQLPAMQWAAAPMMPNPARSMAASSGFASRLATKPSARTQSDPLAALRALSDEEKIALFS